MIFTTWSQILRDFLIERGLLGYQLEAFYSTTAFLVLAAGCFIFWHLSRLLFIGVVQRMVTKTKSNWDDYLFDHKVFRTLSLVVIAYILESAAPFVFVSFPITGKLALMAAQLYVVLAWMFAVNAILNAIASILSDSSKYRDKPIRSYKQVGKIVFYLLGIVWMVSIVIGQSPVYIFTGLGAVTAVLVLIFRDPILGFVASVQMSAIDLVRLGDWITVDKYGADGIVIEINLTTVKVKNWDNTVTLVPSYALVSDSFKNWREMKASEGRRIKRHLNIQISSIRFVDDSLLERLMKIERIQTYLAEKKEEIAQFNRSQGVDKAVLLNGRHLTNIGVFRIYATAYIKDFDHIQKGLTCMVRQLQSTEHGLPLEIYAYTSEKEFEGFESITADLFDHLLAAAPYFDLEIHQEAGSQERSIPSSDQSSWSANI
jgi:miniconductance mechanosensitive channel